MNFFEALLLGAIEGITEFLPISSTGHLIITSELLGLETTEFLKSFEITIQLAAILAVFVLYGKRLLQSREVFTRVAVAFVPTAVIGLLMYKLLKSFLLKNTIGVLWAFLIGGVILILFEWKHRERSDVQEDLKKIPMRHCVYIGLFQSIAIIPGVSRSAATILGGLLLGMKRRAIVEFSFLLAIPTMLAATGYDLLKSAGSFQSGDISVLGVGFVTSFFTALLGIKFLLRFIQTHSFTAFGIYRIAAALIFWLILFA